ncbi:MAG: hypothetical protein F4Z10_09455 [Synechococcus sp. SB0666_bin_14]|nr:hypothetical protein [Synechococcus sp. SB0666_bin_14]MYG47643.1 hypothetical protein [Synechococcus sp. SB0675_bin_6]
MIMEQKHQSTDSILSNARKNFEESKREIEHLLEIHTEMEGGQSGRRGRRPEQIQVLHRAAIVMITACWQAYVEDLFHEASNKLLSHGNAYQKNILKRYVNEKLHYFHNPLRAPRKIAVSSHGRTLPGYEKSLHN